MGHRANYVVIKDGKATAYEDHWGALGCVLSLVDGPKRAQKLAALATETDELMDWAFAEGGYLIDHDQKTMIAFGSIDIDLEDESLPPDYVEEMRDHIDAFYEGPQAFFEYMSPDWKGWTLVWDDRGVDAFSEHLAGRGIASLKTQPPKKRVRRPRTPTRNRPGMRVVVSVPAAKRPRNKP